MSRLHQKNIEIFTLLFFVFDSVFVFSAKEKIHYSIIKQEINVINDKKGYTKRVICKGKFLTSADRVVSLFGGELEKISNIKRVTDHSNRISDEGVRVTERAIVTENFYDGAKEYLIDFNDTASNFSFQYNVACKHLVYLSSLELVTFPNSDTILYQISSPNDYFLKLDFDTSFYFVSVDTNTLKTRKVYTIKSIPNYSVFMRLRLRNRYEINSFIPPRLRVLMIPAGDKNEWAYFNNWFVDLIRDNTKFDNKSIQFIKGIIPDNKVPESIIQFAYEYVKKNIRYVAIENGLEAFKPRDVNSVLINKYGDCKDMANLLSQMLSYYKIDARISLVSTIDYPFKFDFPCLASANHAICVVKSGGKVFYLDPTDKNGTFYLPSEFIQGQNYFAIGEFGYESGEVPVISSKKNIVSNLFDFAVESASLTGKYKSDYFNYSSYEFNHALSNLNESESKKIIDKIIDKKFYPLNQSVSLIESCDSITSIAGEVNISNAITKIGHTSYLLLHSFVFPHQFPVKLNDHFQLITYHAFCYKYTYNISFKEEIRSKYTPPDYEKKLPYMSFSFHIANIGPRSLRIEYSYEINKVEFNEQETREYESLNDQIKGVFNQAYQYEEID